MTSVGDAIRAYHALLSDQLAADTQGALDDQLARRELVFGGRPLCTVLRPRFFTQASYRLLAQRVRQLMRAFDAAAQAAIANPSVRAQFRLAEWEETLIAYDPGFSSPSPTSRLDAFVIEHDDGGATMKLTEYNGETPAGPGFNDALSDAFADLPAMREFARTHHVAPLPARHGVLHSVLDAYRQWSGGTARKPSVAILDWPDVPTYKEFVLFQRHFTDLGLDCVIADPTDAEYRGGVLHVGGRAVDLIYKRVLLHELVERLGVDTPVLQAVRDGRVCMVNSARGKILHKKASLAVLTDERNAGLFSAEDAQVIHEFVPWTRVVEERRTVHHGDAVDLVAYVQRNRERFVLKPNDDYGGAGIVLGWTVDDAEWEEALARALAAPYIVQERVSIPYEPYPSLDGGTVAFAERMIDTAPFVSYGTHADGVLTRLSTAALLNVTAGGGSTVPAFVVEPR
jgi:uncharacterized circularly permuted ATP-grasp superfamily protein